MAGKYPPHDTLTLPKLIICEGPSDVEFLRALIVARGLPQVCIRHTGDIYKSSRGGIDKISAFLTGIVVWEGFYDLTDILILADNDLNPAENFEKVRQQIIDAKPVATPPVVYPVPDAPLTKAAGNPSITICMMPGGNQHGNLETLCLPSARSANQAATECVAQFAQCAGADQWEEITLRSKMEMHSLLAIQHREDPSIGLRNIWRENPAVIPLDHASFTPIAEVIRNL